MSSAGLSSALARIGAVVSHSVAAGAMGTIAIPATAAALLGYLAYQLIRWLAPGTSPAAVIPAERAT